MKKKYFLIIALITTPLFFTTRSNNEYVSLAHSYEEKGNTEKAIFFYEKALEQNPKDWESHFYLGNIFAYQRKYDQAIKQYQVIIALYPRAEQALSNLAICLRAGRYFHEALEMYDRVLSLNPTNRSAHQGKSHTLLTLGRLEEAWNDFEYRWSRLREDSKNFTHYIKNGGSLKGKTVLLRGEFGLGDTLQFIRYAQHVKESGATVIAAVQKQLITILSLCPYLDQVVFIDNKQMPPHDLETVLMSLPWSLGTTLETIPNTIPYLYADQKLAQVWKNRLESEKKFKVGLCWRANTVEKNIPIASFMAHLATNPQAIFYSLLKKSAQDLQTIPNTQFVVDFGPDLDETHGNFMDTAAVMKNVDLVITTDTSLAHLAGGLGVPVWVMLPHDGDWRWLVDREDSPWYPTMRLFRQPKADDWVSVFEHITQELRILTEKKTKERNEKMA